MSALSLGTTHCCKYALSPNKTIDEHFSDLEQVSVNTKYAQLRNLR